MRTALYKKSSRALRFRNQNPFFKKSGERDSFSNVFRGNQNQTFFDHAGHNIHSGSIQPKLTVGEPGDKYEKEADAMADQVMRMPDPQIQKQTVDSDEEEFAKLKAESPSVQMKCDECEKEEESLHRKPLSANVTPFFQRKGTDGSEVNDREAISLKTGKSGGRPLPQRSRNWMESRFGTDFSHVRVHTDSHAVQMSRDLNAQAFTHGSDIYFNRGKFAPDTAAGKHLLAHELTHTLQQQGTIQRQPEHEQDVAADKPLLPGYTQCDFLNERISYEAQYALYHLYRRGGMDRQTSLSILGAVKSNMMQGIYKEDQGKPALMARRHETFWWQLIPKGLGAIVFEAEELPMMVFKKNIANDRAALGNALRDAWDASSLGEKAVIIPPPSLQPCPIVLDPVTIEVEPEKECPPGTIFDPENDLCILDLPGTVKTECTESEMDREFQRQQDFCAGIRMSIDMACKMGAEPWDLLPAPAKLICKSLGGLGPEVCSEPRSQFYERCTVSSVIGGKESMPCFPGSNAQIRDKYRKWPGRVK